MMTKKEFCRCLIDGFCTYEAKESKDLKEEDILKSSRLAVAMEHLDMIENEELKQYASSRGGMAFGPFYDIETEDVLQLSVREILELLPE